MPFSTEFSEEEDQSEADSELDDNQEQEKIDEIESHFANIPTLYPTADASVQTIDLTFTSVSTAQMVSKSVNTSPQLVSCETQWSPQQSPKSISVQVDLLRTSNPSSLTSNTTNTVNENQKPSELRSNSPIGSAEPVKRNNNIDSFRSPVAKFVLNTMNNSQQHKSNLTHSPTPKTQDSDTILSRHSGSVSPNSKQLLKLNNPPPSKFTIPSPHLKGIMLNGRS